jgi:hypothetical protein
VNTPFQPPTIQLRLVRNEGKGGELSFYMQNPNCPPKATYARTSVRATRIFAHLRVRATSAQARIHTDPISWGPASVRMHYVHATFARVRVHADLGPWGLTPVRMWFLLSARTVKTRPRIKPRPRGKRRRGRTSGRRPRMSGQNGRPNGKIYRRTSVWTSLVHGSMAYME